MRIKSLRPALIAGVALTALVCSIAGFAVFSESAIAAPNSVRVSPASASASPGGNVTLDVVAEAPAAKLGAWDLRISFTDSVIQLTSPATPCTGQSNCNLISPGVLGVNGYNASGLSGTQTLASIQFTAVGSAGQSSDVGIQVIDFTDPNSAETNPTIAGGHVTIQVTPTPSPSPSPSPTHTPTPTATPTPTPTATHTATPTFTLTPTPTATPTPGTSSTTSQTASPTGTPSPTPSPTQLTDESGDMNCDGSTNPSDVLTLLEYLLGLVSHIGNCPSS